MNTFAGELMGKDGLPLFPTPENSFSVSIDMYPQEQQASVDAPPAEAFRIVQPNGSVDLWKPPQSSNGELPPHS